MALLTKEKWGIASAGFVRFEDTTSKNMVISMLVQDDAADTVAFKTTPAELLNGITKIYGLETIQCGDLHPPKGIVSTISLKAKLLEISASF